MDWDDLRVVRAVYQAGSYAAAARRLGVNPTTVPRRLARLEKALGVTLFKAVDGVRRATPSCEEVVALTETIARQADRIAAIADKDGMSIERRRITATDSVTACLLAPNLPQFLSEHPDIFVDLLASTENVDFSRWEADIAIRLKRPEKGDFIVSRISNFELYFCEPETDQPIVCAYPEELDSTPESRFLMSRGLQRLARCRTKNLLVIRSLIETGICAGVLPGYMCCDLIDANKIRLTRLPEKRSAWLLIQRHLKDDLPTRQTIDWIRQCFAEH